MVRTFHTTDEFLYCEECGRPTEAVYRAVVDGPIHNHATGEPLQARYHRCPKAGWRGLWRHTDQRVYEMSPRPAAVAIR